MEAARAFGVLALEAIVVAIAAPAISALRFRFAVGAVAGILLIGFGVARLAAPVGDLAGAQLGAHALLGGFAVLLAGLGAALRRGVGGAGWVIAALVGLALLASPFLADPFLEGADRQVRPVVRESALWVNPLAGAASASLLHLDWLRQTVMYRAVSLGQFHAYYYPDPMRQGAVFFAAGLALLLLGRRRIG